MLHLPSACSEQLTGKYRFHIPLYAFGKVMLEIFPSARNHEKIEFVKSL